MALCRSPFVRGRFVEFFSLAPKILSTKLPRVEKIPSDFLRFFPPLMAWPPPVWLFMLLAIFVLNWNQERSRLLTFLEGLKCYNTRDDITHLVVIVLVIIVVVIVQVVVDVVWNIDDRVGDGDHEREERPRWEPVPRCTIGFWVMELLLEHDRHFCRGWAPSTIKPGAKCGSLAADQD